MKLRPLHDRLLVERVDEDAPSKGAIIIPDSAKEKPQQGMVIAAGTGSRLEDGTIVPLDVKAGDRILFAKYGGSEVTIDAKEYLIMRESEVLAVVEGSAQTTKKAA